MTSELYSVQPVPSHMAVVGWRAPMDCFLLQISFCRSRCKKIPRVVGRMFTRRLAFQAILGVIGRFGINPPSASLHRYNCTELLYQQI